jgi:hypothetical protein
VCLLDVFPEVSSILKQLFAFPIATLNDTRRLCVVAGHVIFVILVTFDVLAAKEARVQNGGVHIFLVLI